MKLPSILSRAPRVGVPDPERRTSPILDEETEDDILSLDRESEDGACYFNGVRYALGQRVYRGSEILRCERGVWVRAGDVPH